MAGLGGTGVAAATILPAFPDGRSETLANRAAVGAEAVDDGLRSIAAAGDFGTAGLAGGVAPAAERGTAGPPTATRSQAGRSELTQPARINATTRNGKGALRRSLHRTDTRSPFVFPRCVDRPIRAYPFPPLSKLPSVSRNARWLWGRHALHIQSVQARRAPCRRASAYRDNDQLCLSFRLKRP